MSSAASSTRQRNNNSSSSKTSSILKPLHPLFTILNGVALCGWAYLLCHLLVNRIKTTTTNIFDGTNHIGRLLYTLESICLVEVFRIALRDLPGNLVLGVVLHAMRWTAILVVMPRSTSSTTTMAVLLSWSVTEVTRYPMYLAPQNAWARSIRMVAPLVTFPVGCAAEAYSAYLVLFGNGDNYLSLIPKAALYVMLFVNGVLGPTHAYPALLKKGLPVLLGKSKREQEKTAIQKRV